MAFADLKARAPVDTVRKSWRVVLVDPGLFTAPYDAALSEGLAANGVEPRWATRRLRLNEEDELGDLAMPIFYPLSDGPRRRNGTIWRAVKGIEHFIGLRTLLRYVAATRPDVVHFQWAMLPFLDVATIKQIRRLCPVILTVHDLEPFNGKAVHPLQRGGVDRLWHGVDSLIVHTEAGRKALIATGIDAARVTMVPHGVLGRHADAPPRSPGNGRWRIVQFGRVQDYKGVDLLVEALGRLDYETRSRLSIIIAGEPQIDMTPVQRRADALGLDNATLDFRLKRHSHIEMDALFAEADAFVFPYRKIEASGVLYEIAPLRRWIIASRLGAFTELLGGKAGATMGTLVPPGDPELLAQALKDSIGCKPTGDLGDAIPGWTVIGAKTRAVYTAAMQLWHSDRAAHR